MSKKTNTQNRQVQRTCSWILEALLILMDEKPYGKITVSDITEKAGIARQTFYRNYTDKDEVILKYLAETGNMELLIRENAGESREGCIDIAFNTKFLTEHQANLAKILSNIGIEALLINKSRGWEDILISRHKGKMSQAEYCLFRYKMYYQISGMQRVLYDWCVNGMPVPADALAKAINDFTANTKKQYPGMPNIKFHVISE